MSRDNISYLSFGNGMRGIHLHLPGHKVGYCGVVIKAGSRDENVAARLDGMAHFVEHTIFKGTAKRSSWHIINRMEAIGGELNAFTGKEDTVVYSIFPGANPNRAMELIADLIFNSRFPASELAKEKQVVADEINTYLDIPGEAIFDDFEDMIFAGTSLGHNILGRVSSLATFDTERCRAWLDTYYRPERMAVFYAGSCNPERFSHIVEQYFDIHRTRSCDSPLPSPEPDVADRSPISSMTRRIKGSHQTHVIIGTQLDDISDSWRVATALLTNILGGPGMNSLLNISLRERRGLVYNVEANSSFFSDRGLFSIYYGCDPEHSDLCHRLTMDTIDSIARHGLDQRRLSMARKQYMGQLTVASQNIENHIISLARASLTRGRALTDREIIDHLQAVDTDTLASLAVQLAGSVSLTFTP